jgi:hypothetical protein
MNEKLVKMWKVVVMAYLKLLSRLRKTKAGYLSNDRAIGFRFLAGARQFLSFSSSQDTFLIFGLPCVLSNVYREVLFWE